MNVAFLGALPPPVHGLAIANLAILTLLRDRGDVLVLDRAPPKLANRYLNVGLYFFRSAALLVNFILFCFRKSDKRLYIGVSAGYGQLIDGIFILIAKAFGVNVYIHHHSFVYLNSPKIYHRLFFSITRTCQHVVLCGKMKGLLQDVYCIPERCVRVLSNSALIELVQQPPKVTSNLVFGFLSNITKEKGIFDYIKLADAVHSAYPEIVWRMAGPVDVNIKSELMGALKVRPFIEYCGPVYDQEKFNFLEVLDFLVFPTKYMHEAEPLTILEAQSFGCSILAYDRGCIDCIVADKALVMDDFESLLARTEEIVSNLKNEEQRISKKYKNKFFLENLAKENTLVLSKLINDIAGAKTQC